MGVSLMVHVFDGVLVGVPVEVCVGMPVELSVDVPLGGSVEDPVERTFRVFVGLVVWVGKAVFVEVGVALRAWGYPLTRTTTYRSACESCETWGQTACVASD